VLWRLLDGQPKVTGALAEAYGIGEAVDDGTARARALRRVDNYAGIGRDALEAYVTLDRAGVREELAAHQAQVLELQMPLLSSADFGERLTRARD
jgi:hypothetical protein